MDYQEFAIPYILLFAAIKEHKIHHTVCLKKWQDVKLLLQATRQKRIYKKRKGKKMHWGAEISPEQDFD